MALAAVYVPLDGMNEKGLCVDAGGVMTADEVCSALASAAQSNFSDTNGGELTSRSSPPPSMTQRIGHIPIV